MNQTKQPKIGNEIADKQTKIDNEVVNNQTKIDHEVINLLICQYCGNLLNQQKRNMKEKGIAFTCDICSNTSLFTNSIIIYDSSNITSFKYDEKFAKPYKNDKTVQQAIPNGESSIHHDKFPVFLGQISDRYIGLERSKISQDNLLIQPY